jgi:hypothetical protein
MVIVHHLAGDEGKAVSTLGSIGVQYSYLLPCVLSPGGSPILS